MKEQLVSFLKSPQAKEIGSNLNSILIGFFVFQVSMFIVSIVFKQSVLILHAIAFIPLFLIYFLAHLNPSYLDLTTFCLRMGPVPPRRGWVSCSSKRGSSCS